MSRPEMAARLRDHGVQPTPQRLEVAEILLDRPQHLSAEQLLERLRAKGSRVSKATVYNTLNLFSERGLVRELSIDPSRKFYDSTTHSHHHFFHAQSGRFTDIPLEQIRILGLPELPEGTEQESVEVLIRIRDRQ